jgi:hypothetical protein
MEPPHVATGLLSYPAPGSLNPAQASAGSRTTRREPASGWADPGQQQTGFAGGLHVAVELGRGRGLAPCLLRAPGRATREPARRVS